MFSRKREPIRTEEKDDIKGSGHKNLIFIISANSVTPSGNGHFNEEKFNRDSVQKPHFPYLVNRLSERIALSKGINAVSVNYRGPGSSLIKRRAFGCLMCEKSFDVYPFILRGLSRESPRIPYIR